MRHKILIVEDEPEILALISEELSHYYDVIGADTARAAIELAKVHRPAVALVDVRLPDSSGVNLCGEIRRDPLTSKTKVIMVTGQRDRETLVNCFGQGADDYIFKPFHMEELVARVHSKIQRVKEKGGGCLARGNLELDPDRLAMRISGEETRLSTLEFDLLRFFLENGDKIAGRAEILKAVWGQTTVSDRTVDTHIASLRKRLSRFDHEISTVYGAGYTLQKRAAAY